MIFPRIMGPADQRATFLRTSKRLLNLRKDLAALQLDSLQAKERHKLIIRLAPVAEVFSQLSQEQSSLMAHCRELENLVGDILKLERSWWFSLDHQPDIVPLLSRGWELLTPVSEEASAQLEAQ
jgi:hypothetical protein